MEPEIRAFFYSLFGQAKKRRKILKHWVQQYPLDPKKHTSIHQVFHEFIAMILYEPICFKVRSDHFVLLGGGSKALAVYYAWLDQIDKRFIVERIFVNRYDLFKTCVMQENNHVKLEGFRYDPASLILSPIQWRVNLKESHTGIFSFVWQREIVRDYVWYILGCARKEKRSGAADMRHHLILAFQQLMAEHPYGRRDMFLAAMQQGLQGLCDVYAVPCWGFTAADIHPEEIMGKMK